MRIEEVIGQRIQELRRSRSGEKEMTQEELGELLAPLLGKPWSRQAVSAAEAGKRAFTAVEVIALAEVLDTTVDDLFDLRRQTEITMPSGKVLSIRDQDDVAPDFLRAELGRLLILLRESLTASREVQTSAARVLDITFYMQEKVPEILRYLDTEGVES